MAAMSAHVVSVNVGRVVRASWAGRPQQTAIDKAPVEGPVGVRRLGLDGDGVGDPRFHGGVHQAVYAFAREDLDHWAERLGGPVGPGVFGENLTTVGVDLNETVLGEQWRVGTTLLQPVHVRTPCNTFKAWVGRQGFDNTAWVRRFTEMGRCGVYLRVLEEGQLQAGDTVTVEHRPDHGVTVSTMFAAFMTDPSRLPELLAVDGLKEAVYAAARRQRDR
jgi:MOSC domain-containing protein YiiM